MSVHDPDRRAAALAGHRGDAETARGLLRHPDPEVRAIALGALARMGSLRLPVLRIAADDADPAVRRRVAEVIAGRRRVPAGWRDLLHGLLDDPDPTVVEIAAWACGELQPADRAAVARLAAVATGHDDALTREAAVAALGAIGDPAGLPAILGATSDKPAVRRRAVLALAPFDGPAVDAAIERAKTDRDAQVRQAAELLS